MSKQCEIQPVKKQEKDKPSKKKKIEIEGAFSIVFNVEKGNISAVVKIGKEAETVTANTISEIAEHIAALIKTQPAKLFSSENKKEKQSTTKEKTKETTETIPLLEI